MDCARLVNHEGLPHHVGVPTIILAIVFGVTTFLKAMNIQHSKYLPSGLAVAVGISYQY